jgi:hypothetical protein
MGSLYYRVTLQFWDDLAIVASEHVKKGDRIFVSGRLVSDTVDEGPEKRHVYYKVSSSLVCITRPFSLSLFSLFCESVIIMELMGTLSQLAVQQLNFIESQPVRLYEPEASQDALGVDLC